MPVDFAWADERSALRASRRVLELDGAGRLVQLCWNDRSQRAPTADEADAWFDAAEEFSAMLKSGAHAVSILLKPGEAVMWDNRRILHGREAYEETGAARWLQGAYATDDSVLGAWAADSR